MMTQMNVPLEFVEDKLAEFHDLECPILIENIEFDGLSSTVVVTAEIGSEDATKLPWIETDYEDEIDGVPV
jgi:hypothetical protein